MEFKKTNGENVGGTAFATCFHATKKDIVRAFGKPTYEECNEGEKVQNEWDFDVDGEPITIYDWKEYREFDDDEDIEWHIGARFPYDEEFVRNVKCEICKRVNG